MSELTEREKFEAVYLDHFNKQTGSNKDAAYMVGLRDGDSYGAGRNYLNGMWEGWQMHVALCASVAPAIDLSKLTQTAQDFEDCGETETGYAMLIDWAAQGLLECDHFRLTKKGRDLIEATPTEDGK
jgi:hypothetical protein